MIYILVKYKSIFVFLNCSESCNMKKILFPMKIYSLTHLFVNWDLGTSGLSLINEMEVKV